MNKQQAKKLAVDAIASTAVGSPTPVADATVLFKNADGSWSVCDNGEEVVCESRETAIRIIVENLTA